jgi:hypothetical protein
MEASYEHSMMFISIKGKQNPVKMSEPQTPLQRFEEQTRKTFAKTKESIKNILDKMKNAKHGLDKAEKDESIPK